MNPRAHLAALIFVAGSTAALAHDDPQQQGGVAPEKLGKVSFPTSCSPAVQPLFERGVALLHSFWFPEGLKAFNEVLVRPIQFFEQRPALNAKPC